MQRTLSPIWRSGPAPSKLQVRCYERKTREELLILILVCIYRISIEVVNGMSSTRHVERASIRTTGYDIKDVKFVDDEELVLAACDQGKTVR